MPVPKALRRLFEVRGLEEEQRKAEFESALGELHRLERALSAARAREHAGRAGIAASAQSVECADRIAGLVEMEMSRRAMQMLAPRVTAIMARAAQLRAEYLASRVERRQVETVICETEVLDAAEQNRREQQSADEWFGVRRHREGAEAMVRRAPGPECRPAGEEHEMKDCKESADVPEAEFRPKL